MQRTARLKPTPKPPKADWPHWLQLNVHACVLCVCVRAHVLAGSTGDVRRVW
jgi:hypothetical protein